MIIKIPRVRFISLLCLASAFHIYGDFAPSYVPRLQTLMTDLDRPILVRGAGDNSKRIFVVEQTGIIKVVQPGSSIPTTFIDLSSKISISTSQGDAHGPLGLTFHPKFANSALR